MAVNFALVFASAYKLRYRATRAAGGLQSAIISNQGAATPDIETDMADVSGMPQRFIDLMTTAVASDAAAQAITDESSEINVSVRNTQGQSTFWSAQGRRETTSGNPTLIVAFDDNGAGANGDFCYVDIEYVHTYVR